MFWWGFIGGSVLYFIVWRIVDEVLWREYLDTLPKDRGDEEDY